MAALFHDDVFGGMPVYGRGMRQSMKRRAEQIMQETAGMRDPDVSVVIRTRNDVAAIKQLIGELRAQLYEGDVEILLVDTESSDGTIEAAKALGAKIIPIKQAEFTYPKALNLGFAAAKHPYVVSLVGHSNLVSNVMLKGVTRWQGHRLGGAYGVTLPNYNATWTERFGAVFLGVPRLLLSGEVVHEPTLGMLATNCAVISKKAWQELGGFDERFGSGGEDTQLGKVMLQKGWQVIREPILSVYHTHGIGPIDGFRQWRNWRTLAHGTPFDERQLYAFRPDLRRKSQRTG